MSGKIKICHVINAFENGGAEAVILNYISHMNRSRFEFHVISHGVVSQVCEKKFHDLGFIVHLIPSKKHPLKHVGEMYKICKKEQFDILHIATTEWAFIAGFVGMAAGCKHRINHSHMAECPQGFLSKITFHVKVCVFMCKITPSFFLVWKFSKAISLWTKICYTKANKSKK